MSKYLVTGGAGFIGSHIVDCLVAKGETVRVLDDFSTGKRENIEHQEHHIEVIEGSVTDASTARSAMEGVDFVFHHAAIASVQRSIRDPLESNAVGIIGTLNLLTAARDAGVKRFVYASSSAVYGDNPDSPKTERTPLNPLSTYAITKQAGEYYCSMFTHLFGLETVCLRYFNVFGTRQDPNSEYAAVIPKFAVSLAKGESPTIYGDGTQSRDFSYVDNNVQACLLACHAPDAAGQVFNIGSGESITLLKLLEALNEVLGTNVQPRLMEFRPGDIKHSLADITRAREVLGFSPVIGFRDGLRKFAESLGRASR